MKRLSRFTVSVRATSERIVPGRVMPVRMAVTVWIVTVLFASWGAAPASAQQWLLAPSYGEVELFAGFTGDPYTIELIAGGSDNISHLGYRGFVAEAPDFDLWYEAGSFPLTFRVEASRGTTVLLINDPEGYWHFSDGTALTETDGLPRIVFRRPRSGLYNVWVGTVRNEFIPARLLITEY